MSFFKSVMIVWLKIYAAVTFEVKFVSRGTFFPICGLWSREGQGDLIFGQGDIQLKGKVKTFGFAGRPPQWDPHPPLAGHTNLPISKTLRRVLGLLTVEILKRVRVFSFKATNLQHVSLKMRKSWQILWWHSIYWRLSIPFKVRSI